MLGSNLAVLLAIAVPRDGGAPAATFDASEWTANGGADLPWQQSYKAGQKDANGAMIGGSEIMHIKVCTDTGLPVREGWCTIDLRHARTTRPLHTPESWEGRGGSCGLGSRRQEPKAQQCPRGREA